MRSYVAECGFEDTLLHEYGIWDRAEDIDFDVLPENFVLKCTHDSGSTKIIIDKSKHLDKDNLTKFYRWHLKFPFGYKTVEPHYTKISPRVISEEILPHLKTNQAVNPEASIVDYKFLCFDGEVQFVLLTYNRNISNHSVMLEVYEIDSWTPRREYLAEKYKHQEFRAIPKPENIHLMVKMAKRLSKGFPQVRVDLYSIDGSIFFTELTFTSAQGRVDYYSDEFQLILGSKIRLPEKKCR